MKNYFKITGPGIAYFPIDIEEVSRIIEWMNGSNSCILLKKGLLHRKTPFCIMEDYDRENGWNIILDKRGDKRISPPGETMTDSMKEIRELMESKKESLLLK